MTEGGSGWQHTMDGAWRIEGRDGPARGPGIAIITAAGGGEARERRQGPRKPTLTQRVGSSRLGWLHAWWQKRARYAMRDRVHGSVAREGSGSE